MNDFIKGSSLAAALPTLLYVGFYQRKNRLSLLKNATSVDIRSFLSIPFESFSIGILLAYGLAYSSLQRDESEERSSNAKSVVISGAILGLSLSLIGRFVFDLPVKMFGIPRTQAWKVHPTAIILYILIFLYVNKVLN